MLSVDNPLINARAHNYVYIISSWFQFFITLGESLDYLDGVHTVFGEVAEGFEVLDKLNEAYCDEKHRPYRDIRFAAFSFHEIASSKYFGDENHTLLRMCSWLQCLHLLSLFLGFSFLFLFVCLFSVLLLNRWLI